jgi:endonuclease VIII
VPEGDALHRAAARLKVLEGEVLSVETPHPRAQVLGLAERLHGRRLERVEAIGKNLLFTFEGGAVLRSHLRMNGRWRVQPAGSGILGKPWLVLRGGEWEAVQRNGPVLELTRRKLARLGPDIMVDPPDLDGMVERFRRDDQGRELGDALLDQRLVAGIGNMWKAETLFCSSASPWLRLGDASDEDLRHILTTAHELMTNGRRKRFVYRRTSRPCSRCGTAIRSYPQGDAARMAYWCPGCQSHPPTPGRGRHQAGTEAAEA